MTDVIGDTSAAVRRQDIAYRGDEERPLAGYLGLMAGYAAAVAAGGVAVRRHGVPDRLAWGDLALLTVATHKLSRLLAKDPVTSTLRAPFTRFKGPAGHAELNEDVRGSGGRKAVGELVTCPFCLDQWVATGLAFGFVLAPRASRLAASVLASVAGADFLHLAYAAAANRVD